ncbi:MAG: phosphatase PAP2 family protein, partial [Actinobacteria bacterium]|nr:phosphatase PAP2 family protein [Actinomycetota bacterium]MCA1699895.1 phosphatase PAP2 family protein [Actinomycetota bacterium]
MSTRTTLAAIALLSIAVAASWAIVALAGSFPGDRKLAAEIAKENLGPIGLAPAHALDILGYPAVALAVVAALAIAVGLWLGWRHGALVIAALGASLITTLLKHLFDRERPPTGVELDPSFPSGHTAYATAVFGLVFALTVRERRYWLAAICGLIVAAMGPSRLLLGVHYLSDVLAGYAVGLAWLLVLLAVGLRGVDNARRRHVTD